MQCHQSVAPTRSLMLEHRRLVALVVVVLQRENLGAMRPGSAGGHAHDDARRIRRRRPLSPHRNVRSGRSLRDAISATPTNSLNRRSFGCQPSPPTRNYVRRYLVPAAELAVRCGSICSSVDYTAERGESLVAQVHAVRSA